MAQWLQSAGCVIVYRSNQTCSWMRHITPITVQHGSADPVVRAMNVKYRKWRLGVSCNSKTP